MANNRLTPEERVMQQLEQQAANREKRKKGKMKVSNKKIFELKKIITRGR